MPQSLARLKPQKTNTFSKDGGHSLTMICSVGTLLLICRDQGGMDALIKCTSTVLCMCVHAQLLESCPTLCDPVDCTVAAPPSLLCPWDSPDKNTGVGCHVHLQGSSRPRDQTHVSYVSCIGRQVLYHQCHLGGQKCHLSFKAHILIYLNSILSCMHLGASKSMYLKQNSSVAE